MPGLRGESSLRWGRFSYTPGSVALILRLLLVVFAVQLQLERGCIRRAAAPAATARANPHLPILRPLKWHPRPVPS